MTPTTLRHQVGVIERFLSPAGQQVRQVILEVQCQTNGACAYGAVQLAVEWRLDMDARLWGVRQALWGI